jgi:hypothetical protein
MKEMGGLLGLDDIANLTCISYVELDPSHCFSISPYDFAMKGADNDLRSFRQRQQTPNEVAADKSITSGNQNAKRRHLHFTGPCKLIDPLDA